MHQCIKCGYKVEGDLKTIVTDGCPECGSKFFTYTKKGPAKKVEEGKGESVEGVMIKGQGVYEVNLSSLLENDSVIVSNEEGKYLIDINTLLKKKLDK